MNESGQSAALSKAFGMPVFCINANPEISTFAHAKQTAASWFRRLIVNVLDQSMPSLDQNRDLWAKDDVAALVVEHFCLFQLHFRSDAAEEYLQLYPLRQGVDTYKLPIIDILDPLTGMLEQRLSGAVAKRQLCGVLEELLMRDRLADEKRERARRDSMAKVKLGSWRFHVDSESFCVNNADITVADFVALAARMKSGEIRRVKKLCFVRLF
jgi:hypothetical protein